MAERRMNEWMSGDDAIGMMVVFLNENFACVEGIEQQAVK